MPQYIHQKGSFSIPRFSIAVGIRIFFQKIALPNRKGILKCLYGIGKE
jgi:hypothetical protein